MCPASSPDPTPTSTSHTTPAVGSTSTVAPAKDKDSQPGHSLRRNQACLSCRKRKLKCDAQRPVCGTCVRSREAAAINKYISPVPEGDCVYPDFEPAPLPEGPEHTLPPAYRSSSARSRRAPSDPSRATARARKRARRSTQSEADDLRASVARLEQLLAESQKTIEAQRELAERNGVALMPPASSDGADDIFALGSLPAAGGDTGSRPTARTQRSGPSGSDLVRMSPRGAGNGVGQPPLIGRSGDGLDRIMSMSHNSQSIDAWDMLNGAQTLPNGSTGTITGISGARWGFSPAESLAFSDVSAFTSMLMGPSSLGGPMLAPPSQTPPPSILSLPIEAGQSPSEGTDPDLFAQLLWPGWPADLPPPETVYALVDIFFAQHPMRVLFREAEFKRRLRLQPSSNRWPDKALLHTIVAAAAPMSNLFKPGREPPVVCVSSQIRTLDPSVGHKRNWRALGPLHPNLPVVPGGATSVEFADFHLAMAQAHISCGLSMLTSMQGRNPPELLQALIIVGDVLYQRARVVECYLLTGMFCKSLAPCGLLKLRPFKRDSLPIPGCFIPSSTSVEEEEMRRRTFWYAYMDDAWHSNPGFYYASSINDDVVTTSLPSASRDKCQVLATPDEELFGSGHTDDFTLHVKAVVLFKRVRKLLSEPEPRTRMTPAFAQRVGALDEAIHLFLSTCPQPTDLKRMDLLCARLAALGSLAMLHDPFVNFADPLSYPFQQVHRVIDETMGLVDLIRASDVDPGHLPSRTLLTFMTSAKLLAEHLSHLRLAGTSSPTLTARWEHLRDKFDKLLLLLRDMNSTGVFFAAQEAYLRLSELRRCKFDYNVVERHHYAVQMPPMGTSRFQAV